MARALSPQPKTKNTSRATPTVATKVPAKSAKVVKKRATAKGAK